MKKAESVSFSPKKRFIKKMFNDISQGYDLVNRFISFGFDGICRKMVVSCHKDDSRVLDICSGTGEMTVELLKQKDFKGTVILGDFSSKMHLISRKKIDNYLNGKLNRYHTGKSQAFFVYCDAERLPFKDGVFDGVINGYSLRNLDNLRIFGLEISRVLNFTGHSSIIDLAHPPNKIIAWIFHLYFYRLVPPISRFFTEKGYAYCYLSTSLSEFFKQGDILTALTGDSLNGHYQNVLKGAVAIYRLWK
jgi:demethylmenaquinone methyltransferase/2-methoxy-6-polyprenyl-1,4-benzoquinol methylase